MVADSDARREIGGIVFGAMAAEVLFAAAEFAVADRIGDGGASAAALAAELGADEQATTRLLRALAAMGLLEEPMPGMFRLTEAGGLLREDRPDSMLAFVRMFGDPTMLAARPELSAQFNAAMRQGTALTARQLPSNYDFSRFQIVADVGGGDGTLLSSVLQAHPALRGVLFDTAEGLAQADRVLGAAGVGERVTTMVGDFFKSAPGGADIYVLKSVIHDWNDAQCVEILGHVRRAVPTPGRVLLV